MVNAGPYLAAISDRSLVLLAKPPRIHLSGKNLLNLSLPISFFPKKRKINLRRYLEAEGPSTYAGLTTQKKG